VTCAVGQFESGSGSGNATAPAFSSGVGLRRAGTSGSRPVSSRGLSGGLPGAALTEISDVTKIGPCVGHS